MQIKPIACTNAKHINDNLDLGVIIYDDQDFQSVRTGQNLIS
jgi:hypothetical protein